MLYIHVNKSFAIFLGINSCYTTKANERNEARGLHGKKVMGSSIAGLATARVFSQSIVINGGKAKA